MLNSPGFAINIDDLPIDIAIYQVKDGDIYFIDLNLAARVREKISKNRLIGKKTLRFIS